eukprot:m.1194723 g.1194723  ORF g.1194723 m.1194723 type:complete len:188 (-) comp24562_c1_seq28:2187-2750(-)
MAACSAHISQHVSVGTAKTLEVQRMRPGARERCLVPWRETSMTTHRGGQGLLAEDTDVHTQKCIFSAHCDVQSPCDTACGSLLLFDHVSDHKSKMRPTHLVRARDTTVWQSPHAVSRYHRPSLATPPAPTYPNDTTGHPTDPCKHTACKHQGQSPWHFNMKQRPPTQRSQCLSATLCGDISDQLVRL